MDKKRILIVDDEPDLVETLKVRLGQENYECLAANDGHNGLELALTQKPDLVILDIMLPGIDGFEVCRRIKSDASTSHVPVLILTARADDASRLSGYESQADDYLTKPFSVRELVRRVRAVLRRVGPAREEEADTSHEATLRFDPSGQRVWVDGEAVDLTPTEFELLRALMESPGHAFTRSELIEKGLGYTYEGLDRTLDSHIKNLRRKIEPDPGNPIYIQTVYGVGYRLQPEQPFDFDQDRQEDL